MPAVPLALSFSLASALSMVSTARAGPPEVQRPDVQRPGAPPASATPFPNAQPVSATPPVAPQARAAASPPPAPLPATRKGGLIDKNSIAAFMQGRFAQVDVCAARARADEPGIAGRVSIAFSLDTGGRVIGSRVHHSEIQNKVLTDCLIATANTWALPAPIGGPAQFTYTFRFDSSGGPGAAGWRKASGAVGPDQDFPTPPTDLGNPRRPLPPPKPGRSAMRWGYGLFIIGEMASLSMASAYGNLWALPIFGPPLAAKSGEESAAAGIVSLQVVGIALAVRGHLQRRRYNREQRSAWSQHRMNASINPAAGGAQVNFGMSF